MINKLLIIIFSLVCTSQLFGSSEQLTPLWEDTKEAVQRRIYFINHCVICLEISLEDNSIEGILLKKELIKNIKYELGYQEELYLD